MNRVQRRDFGPSVRELDREGEDAQTRGFGVVGHGVGAVDEVDGKLGVAVEGVMQGRRDHCAGEASWWSAGVVDEGRRSGDAEAAGTARLTALSVTSAPS